MKLIALREDIGIKNIKEFHSELLNLLGNENEVVLDFAKVKRIDLSVAQVLMAAHRIAKNGSKLIKLKGVSQTVKEQLKISGLTR